MYYKATIRPENAPIPHNKEDPTSLVDENQWVYDAYNDLRQWLTNAIDPLFTYLEIYKKYE